MVLDRQPLASQSAKGKPTTSSISVTVSAMRKVLTATSQRPDSNSENQVFSEGW